jgi:N-acetylglucosamine malate deacetylase 1
MNHELDVLAVFAHPDDAELLCGGTLARCVDEGESVGILDLTRGEAASRGTPEEREREAAAAAVTLGVRIRRNVGLPDAGIENSPSFRLRVATHLRALRPRVVVTHWTEGRHPDHRAAACLVRDAAFLAGLRSLDIEGAPYRPHKLVYALAFREDAPAPSFVVDVSEQIDRKLEAMACFASQWKGSTGAGEVYPGGDRPLADQVRAHLAHHGSRIRARYGEPFLTMETLEVSSLGGLRVSTF